MLYMICMNKLKDYSVWRKIFDSHKLLHEKAGMHLEKIWRAENDSNEIYFYFRIDNKEKAEAFINDPAYAHVGVEAGVLDGWIKYVEDIISI